MGKTKNARFLDHRFVRSSKVATDIKDTFFTGSPEQFRDRLGSLIEQLHLSSGDIKDSTPAQLPEQKVMVQHSVPRIMIELIRSQYQLLYHGLRPILEQTVNQAKSNDRLKAAIDDCRER
ncbi:MAG: hypothetical protein SGI77_26285 [Pirellulaceae bacterium]|nr:hypothetical protein [Pirellulaceae bacterium]